MTPSASTETLSARLGSATVAVSDRYFQVEPATAVIVSANSHLRAATGGAYEVAKAAGQGYEPACNALLHAHPDGLPQGSAWIVDGDFKLTGGIELNRAAVRRRTTG